LDHVLKIHPHSFYLATEELIGGVPNDAAKKQQRQQQQPNWWCANDASCHQQQELVVRQL